jgi:hypothetical protein
MIEIIERLGLVEADIVRQFANRILFGQGRYGKFGTNLEKNENLVQEMLEEVLDCQVYCQRLLNIIDNYEIVVKLKEDGGNDDNSGTNQNGSDGNCKEPCGQGMSFGCPEGRRIDCGEDREDGGEADEASRRTGVPSAYDLSMIAAKRRASRSFS